ncbi:hypothetical protein NDU88_006698 [Pleurodeles waltl]|uniref:Uncharacterized protein n=1 Tax=Pleurodeles waltl TaxID=8319 RepID=A0AAV7RQZ9_PLEWA|nr:hypothetical protein NDU88_006698 [Pleurodeles waltl]
MNPAISVHDPTTSALKNLPYSSRSDAPVNSVGAGSRWLAGGCGGGADWRETAAGARERGVLANRGPAGGRPEAASGTRETGVLMSHRPAGGRPGGCRQVRSGGLGVSHSAPRAAFAVAAEGRGALTAAQEVNGQSEGRGMPGGPLEGDWEAAVGTGPEHVVWVRSLGARRSSLRLS